MNVTFAFNGVPLGLSGNIERGGRAYFTIPSKGIVAHRIIGSTTWEKIADKIDLILHGVAQTDSEILGKLQAIELLSFPDTIKVLECFTLDANGLASALGVEFAHIDGVKFEFCKEGQTSSVWKAVVTGENTRCPILCAVNVARDRIAGEDLWHSSIQLEAISNTLPNIPVAEVIALRQYNIGRPGRSVVIALNRWVDDAQELHVAGSGEDVPHRLLTVERFEIDVSLCGRISTVHGRELSRNEQLMLMDQLRRIDTSFKTAFNAGVLQSLPRIEINEGDLVLTSTGAVIVALSASGPALN